MAELSRFWSGTSVGDAGAYSADQFADYMRNALFSSSPDVGPFLGSGVEPDPGLSVQQLAIAGAAVQVVPGSAHVHGYYYELTATQQINVAANSSGNPRIDTIILRADWVAQTVRLAILQGTPAGSPTPLALTQSEGVRWEIPLADIAVANAFVTIVQANITPRTNWANMAGLFALMDVLNNSGGYLQTGDVVIRDTTADRAATTTTTKADSLFLGVWTARTTAGSYGRVIQHGIAYVNLSGAATRGDAIVVSATAKQADVVTAASAATTSRARTIGIALQTTGGAGLCLCYIDVNLYRATAFQRIQRNNSADYTTASAAFVDVDTTNLALTIVTESPNVLVLFSAVMSNTAATFVCLDITVDGTRIGTVGSPNGLVTIPFTAGGTNGANLAQLVTGLAPGSHTFKIQWRTAAGTASIQANSGVDSMPIFSVQEIA